MKPEGSADPNPYAAPKADVDLPEALDEVPSDALRKIRGAWIAGLVSTLLTLAFAFFTSRMTGTWSVTVAQFVAAGLIGVLAFGIYRRSRICAVLMVLLFLADRWLIFQSMGFRVLPMLVALIFLYFYVNGVIGTFAYHRFMDAGAGRGGDER